MTLQTFCREKLADLETPVSAYRKLCGSLADSFLLESVEPHETVGRFSIVAWDPLLSLELRPQDVTVTDNGGSELRPADEFFSLIRRTLIRYPLAQPYSLPAVGSLLGFIGYDAVRLIEPVGPARPAALPMARLVLPSRFAVFDRRRRMLTLVALDQDQKKCREKIAEAEARLASPLEPLSFTDGLRLVEPSSQRFMAAVSRAKEYIRAGDAFQIVLADCFEGETAGDPFQVYRLLRVRSPSPYLFYLNFGGYKLVGASPETMVKVRNNRVILRPIAGTRGRSDDPDRDQTLEQELLASEKERAEHVMLVDLARNDAGRVSRYGTVKVAPYMNVERYSHVMHLVSMVQGELRPGADLVDAFQAGFPAGTVSGAPKVRAMQIIDELEARVRGPYAGAVGYFGPGNEMDTCIAIRLIVFEGNRFTIPVGAGIVADSEPEMEYREIHHKAGQSLMALKLAAEGEGL
ncbi:MAG: anthranilate synthase component I family protein [Thermodesulfobacteriota bacterium]